MTPFKHTANLLFSLFFLLLAMPSLAASKSVAEPAAANSDPYQMLKQATDQLLQVSKEAKTYAKNDPERYYREILAVLDPVLDFEYFSRGAMGTYGSARRYKTLTSEQEKAAFRERVNRFNDTLKRTLLVTYSDALLSFNGSRIELEKSARPVANSKNTSLVQKIYDEDGKSYTVQYSLRKDKSGDWLVYNVIVEGINLGQLYRNQFADAVEQNKGDVDYVVDHWADIMRKSTADKTASARVNP